MSDARPEVPPPRYQQVGNYQYLICDEQEWLARPAAWGIDALPGPARERKSKLHDYFHHLRMLQFVACGACRRAFAEMISEESVIFFGSAAELQQRYDELHAAGPRCDAWPVWAANMNYARGAICPSDTRNAIRRALDGIAGANSIPRAELAAGEQQLALELIGPNPFRPITFAPQWRTGTAMALARNMYESRDFGAMPILADALQDAGCDSDDVLNHCRNPKQVHVRGCWVCDQVLGS